MLLMRWLGAMGQFKEREQKPVGQSEICVIAGPSLWDSNREAGLHHHCVGADLRAPCENLVLLLIAAKKTITRDGLRKRGISRSACFWMSGIDLQNQQIIAFLNGDGNIEFINILPVRGGRRRAAPKATRIRLIVKMSQRNPVFRFCVYSNVRLVNSQQSL